MWALINATKLPLLKCLVSEMIGYRLQVLYLSIIRRFVQVQTAGAGSPFSVSAAPVVRQPVISERPWGGGSGFCGAHCLLSIYALGFCRFLVLFWPAAQPQVCLLSRLSVQVSSHNVNPIYGPPDLRCSFTFGYNFCQFNI